jgi:hypothetical protein
LVHSSSGWHVFTDTAGLSSTRFRHLQALSQGILKACRVAGGVFEATKIIDPEGFAPLADDNPYVSQLFLDALVRHENPFFRSS